MEKNNFVVCILLFCLLFFSGNIIFAGDEISFNKIADMNERRSNFAAILLNDGRVFISGGFIIPKDKKSSELVFSKTTEFYNPETKTFSKGPEMNSERFCHSMKIMDDGRVLIAGGIEPSDENDSEDIKKQKRNLLFTLEIFDPKTGTVTLSKSFYKIIPAYYTADYRNPNIYALGNNTYLIGGLTLQGEYKEINPNPFFIFDAENNIVYTSENINSSDFKGYSPMLYKDNGYIKYFDIDKDRYAAQDKINKKFYIHKKSSGELEKIIEFKTKRKYPQAFQMKDGRLAVYGLLAENTGETSPIEIFDKNIDSSFLTEAQSKIILNYSKTFLSNTADFLFQYTLFEIIEEVLYKQNTGTALIPPVLLPDGNVFFAAAKGYYSEIFDTSSLEFNQVKAKTPQTFEKAVVLNDKEILFLGQQINYRNPTDGKYSKAYILSLQDN